MEMMRDFDASSAIPSWSEPAGAAVIYLSTLYAIRTYRGSMNAKKEDGGPSSNVKDVTSNRMGILFPLGILHNAFLIALSLTMFVFGCLALRERYAIEGFDGVFCSQRPIANVLDGSAGFWLRIFYWSKFYELLDTVFLALRDKPIIFLHVYHHVVMLFVTCSWLKFGWLEGSLWCLIVNSLIHTFMYTYYLLALCGVRCWWKKYLTAGQLVQFGTGCVYVAIFAYRHLTVGCGDISRVMTAAASIAVNLTFIFLFAVFFKSKYATKKKKNTKAA